MRTRRMSTSVDPRVGQLVTTTGPKRGVGIQTQMYENSTTPRRPHNTRHETQPHNNRVGALVWSHPGDWFTPVGPGRTSTVHGCPSRWEGCGWPETTTTDKKTTAHSNIFRKEQTYVMTPEGVSACRSRSAEGELVADVYDYVKTCSSLKGIISDIQVIEDFESRPHKAVTFAVQRGKAGMERAKIAEGVTWIQRRRTTRKKHGRER